MDSNFELKYFLCDEINKLIEIRSVDDFEARTS
jgi:hypothetical protein